MALIQSRAARRIPSWPGIALLLAGLLARPGAAHSDNPLPIIGGNGGGPFEDRCPPGMVLFGVELRAADDVDAIRTVCARPVQPAQLTDDTVGNIWHGGDGGMQRRIACPLARPVVLGIEIGREGQKTVIVNNIRLFCGSVSDVPQRLDSVPAAAFDGPPYSGGGNAFGSAFRGTPTFDRERCPPGQVATGIHGSSGVWLDAVGLICGASPLTPATVHSIGRVNVPPGKPGPKLNFCQEAALAQSRGQTVAAAALQAKCLETFKH